MPLILPPLAIGPLAIGPLAIGPLAIAPLLAVAIAAAAWAQGPTPDTAAQAQRDLQQLGAVLTSADASASQREEAARRLVDRERTERDAGQILHQLFDQSGSVSAQIAIARALSQAIDPDPSFIPALSSSLGGNVELTRAASAALVNYRDDPRIPQILEGAANNQSLPDPSREAIVRAMGGIIAKPVARFLERTLLNGSESPRVQDAAADALGEMTGLHDLFGRDRQQWQRWWNNNANKSDEQWRADVLGNQLRQFALTKQHYDQLVRQLPAALEESYVHLPTAADKAAALSRYLASTVPEIRVAGAVLVSDDFTSNRAVPAEVRQQLRTLIGDSDPSVRLAVINTLTTINDRSAAPALITQLVQETDPNVKRQIATALGRIGDPAAVGPLVNMLRDPIYDDGAAAADALAQLAPVLHQQSGQPEAQFPAADPQLAQQAVAGLQGVLTDRRISEDPQAVNLRAACARALAALSDPHAPDAQSRQIFLSLLRSEEPPQVRIAGLDGLGALADPNTADAIQGLLSDPDANVRLAAAQALGRIIAANPPDQVYPLVGTDLLYRMLDPGNEPDARVRDAAWGDLSRALTGASEDQLVVWIDRFRSDPQKKLVAQQAMAAAMARANQQQPLAEQRQDIGETLMSLGRYDDAVASFQQALDYWNGHAGADLTGLVRDMTDALLHARQYDQLVSFAQKQLSANPAYQEVIGSAIKNEASRLADPDDKDAVRRAADSADAERLIDAALSMNAPPLEQRYVDDLKQTRSQLNAAPAPGP